jgi:hypothetical protein
VFMRLALALFCISSSSTMQLHTHTAARGHLPPSTTPEPCLALLLCRTTHVCGYESRWLVASVYSSLHVPSWTMGSELDTHCAGGVALQAGAPPMLPTTDCSSSFAAFTTDGEGADEGTDLSCLWDTGPKHTWIYSSHHDICADVPTKSDVD